MGAVDMGSTEDTLSESPGENAAGEEVARDVHRQTARLDPPLSLPRALDADEEPHQREQQPPPAGAERVEPERGEERERRAAPGARTPARAGPAPAAPPSGSRGRAPSGRSRTRRRTPPTAGAAARTSPCPPRWRGRTR